MPLPLQGWLRVRTNPLARSASRTSAALKFAQTDRVGLAVVVGFSVSQGRTSTTNEVNVPPKLSGVSRGSVKCLSQDGIRVLPQAMARALLIHPTTGRLEAH